MEDLQPRSHAAAQTEKSAAGVPHSTADGILPAAACTPDAVSEIQDP